LYRRIQKLGIDYPDVSGVMDIESMVRKLQHKGYVVMSSKKSQEA